MTSNAFKHGMRDSPEYKAWSEAKQRCHNENSDKFKWYGARGITVCDEWMEDFEAFYAHIGPKPGPEYEIDRIDNNNGYQPGNVRWATKHENNMNRRNTVRIQYNGEEITLFEYAKREGIKYATAWARMKKHPHLITGEKGKRVGELNGNTKLTDAQVLEIRNSSDRTKLLQKKYGVSRSLIQGIRRGELRRSLESTRRIEAKTV